MTDLHTTIAALGDATRFAIVERLLREGETSAGELHEGMPISAPALSRHLKVLRKAGFSISGGRGSSTSSRRSSGKRVSSDEVRAAIPARELTAKELREKSGASPAVVRKVIGEEVDAGTVTEVGQDPNHSGPGRAPILYEKK